MLSLLNPKIVRLKLWSLHRGGSNRKCRLVKGPTRILLPIEIMFFAFGGRKHCCQGRSAFSITGHAVWFFCMGQELIAYAQKPPLSAHADVSGGARGQSFCLSLHLYPYFVYASSKDRRVSYCKFGNFTDNFIFANSRG